MIIKIYDKSGKEVKKEVKKLKWIEFQSGKTFEHYMLKEIHEQPQSSKTLLDSVETEQSDIIEYFLKEIQDSNKVIFIAAGSSYHSSLIGSYLLKKLGIDARAVLASEYDMEIYDKNTLVIAVSQSGETMDVILALKKLKDKVKNILSIVNVPYSTIQRMSEKSIEIKAGPEKAVAATKTYTNQVILFYYLAKKLGLKEVKIEKIPEKIKYIIEHNEKYIRNFIVSKLVDERDIYIIGRGINYLASMEIALKLKEISYIHAEALAAGELKHGTLALIEKETKVIALAPFYDTLIKTNIEEVEARGANVINVPRDFKFPEHSLDFPIYSVIIGQLVTYYLAREKGLPIDKPRNLAKSVTVI